MPQMSSGASALTARAGRAPETTDHAVPFHCRTEESANAQAFVGLKSRTALRTPSSGPVTTDHAVPFQCSYSESCIFPELCSPTAHASLALLAATDASAQSGVLPDG